MLLLTNSPFWVGLAAGVRGASQAAFSIPAGSFADRLDRRRMLLATQCTAALAALALGALVLTHIVRPWHILVYVVIAGALYSANRPCLNGLIYEVVGERRLHNASAFQSMAGGIFRIVGALAGGFIIDRLGVGENYLLVACCYLAGSGALLAFRVPAGARRAPEPLFGAVVTGLGYAMRSSRVRSLLLLSFLNESFGFSFSTMLPVMARDVLRVDALGMASLTATSGAGQLAATARIIVGGDLPNKGRLVVSAALGFGVCVVLFGLCPWFFASLVLTALIGFMGSTYDATMATVMQLAVANEMRGRMLGLYSFTLSLSPLGGLVTGTVATLLTTPLAIAVSGAVVIAGALAQYPGLGAASFRPYPVAEPGRPPS